MEPELVNDIRGKLQSAVISVLMQRLGVKEVHIDQTDMNAVSKFIDSNASMVEFEILEDGRALDVRLTGVE